MNMKRTFIATLAIFLIQLACAQQKEWKLSSPDKKISATISHQGKLTYTVAYDQKRVIETSPLGIVMDDQQFSSNLAFVEQKTGKVVEQYTLMVGKRLKANDSANEL